MDIDLEEVDISKRHLEFKPVLLKDDAMEITLTPLQNNLNVSVSGLPLINDTYEVVWKPAVIARVSAILLLMALTLLGNAALLLMILCHRKLRRRRVNIFLVNLAIGDLLVCAVTMSTEIAFVAWGEWMLGATGCKLTVYGQIVTLASTTFLLTAMSIDRYQVIVRPLQSLRGQPKIWMKVLCAWAMAFLFATPQFFIFVQTDVGVHSDGSVKHLCKSDGYQDGQTWQRKAYFTFLATYILVLPTAIMAFCYINIIRVVFMRAGDNRGTPKLRFTSSRRPSTSASVRKNSSDSQSEFECAVNSRNSSDRRCRRRSGGPNITRFSIPKKLISSSKRNVVKMTLSVIIAFIVCWSPYFVIGLIRIYSEYEIQLTQWYSVAEIMAMLHSALNPILYGAFSSNSAIATVKTTCFNRRKSEKIVVNISVGSEFDSLVFITHPELYTRRLSLAAADANISETCTWSWVANKLCFCKNRNGTSGDTKYTSVAGNSPRQKKVNSSVRSQLSQDSNAFISSHAQCTHTSSLSGNSADVDVQPSDIRALNFRRSSVPCDRVKQRLCSYRSEGSQGQLQHSKLNGSQGQLQHCKVIGSQGQLQNSKLNGSQGQLQHCKVMGSQSPMQHSKVIGSQGQMEHSQFIGSQGQLQHCKVVGSQGQGIIEHYKFTGSKGCVTVQRK